MMPARRTPPRLVTRALVASFLTVALILAAVFVLVTLDVRVRMRDTVRANLDAAQQVFARVEARLDRERLATVSTVVENPTLKAALDTWQTERRAGSGTGELVETVRNELQKIQDRIDADVLAIVDAQGGIVASTGPRAGPWRPGRTVRSPAPGGGEPPADDVITLDREVFRVRGVPLVAGGVSIGTLQLATALDAGFASELATLARAQSAILIGDRVHATTLPDAVASEIGDGRRFAGDRAHVVDLAGSSWAVRRVGGAGDASFLALASIDEASAAMTRSAFVGLASIGVVALALAGFGSLWLARALTRPIDRLSASLSEMTVARRFDAPVVPPGSSRELDALAGTFNALMGSLVQAEAETEAAYLGAIRALAAALDARDPYTAGHSERVSTLSVEIGTALGLGEADLAVLRLGALLHDIGKIGVPDEVLRKPAALTAAEFELIRAHPLVGARILRSIPFLTPHLPIVELHHERPDGRGYPYGLKGDAIPLAARIAHVADAFDAMTSARAYRPARLPHEAIAELQRCAGTDFDPAAVGALVTALPRLPAAFAAFDATAFRIAAFQRAQVS
jgi:putative nucleotidyltransferase with HDIG domain